VCACVSLWLCVCECVCVCVCVAMNRQDVANTRGHAIIVCTLPLLSVYHWTAEPSIQSIASFTGAPIPGQTVPVNILPPVPLCR